MARHSRSESRDLLSRVISKKKNNRKIFNNDQDKFYFLNLMELDLSV